MVHCGGTKCTTKCGGEVQSRVDLCVCKLNPNIKERKIGEYDALLFVCFLLSSLFQLNDFGPIYSHSRVRRHDGRVEGGRQKKSAISQDSNFPRTKEIHPVENKTQAKISVVLDNTVIISYQSQS